MFTLYLFFAAIVETVNELTFGRVFGENKPFSKLGCYLPFTALGFAIAFSFIARVTIVTWAAQVIAGIEFQLIPAVDHFISGVLISAGSRYLHQLLSQYAPENSVA